MGQTDELAPLRQLRALCAADFQALAVKYPELTTSTSQQRLNNYICKQIHQEGNQMPAKGYRTMGEELENVAMRLPLSVLVDVDAHIDTLRKTAPWAKVGRSDALRDLVVRGLHSVQEPLTARQSSIPQPQHELPLTSASVPVPPPTLLPGIETPPVTTPTPAAKPHRDLPEHIIKIAEVAAEYDRMSTRELAQLLYDRNIYRATAAKTAEEKPVSPGTLARWLHEARDAGLL